MSAQKLINFKSMLSFVRDHIRWKGSTDSMYDGTPAGNQERRRSEQKRLEEMFPREGNLPEKMPDLNDPLNPDLMDRVLKRDLPKPPSLEDIKKQLRGQGGP